MEGNVQKEIVTETSSKDPLELNLETFFKAKEAFKSECPGAPTSDANLEMALIKFWKVMSVTLYPSDPDGIDTFGPLPPPSPEHNP